MQALNNGLSDWHRAARQGDLDGIKSQLAQGHWIDEPDSKGRSALYHASKKGYRELAELLIQRGAVNYPSLKGKDVKQVAAGNVADLITKLAPRHFEDVLQAKFNPAAAFAAAKQLQEPVKFLAFASIATHEIFLSYERAWDLINKIPPHVKGRVAHTEYQGYDSPSLRSNTAAFVANGLLLFGNFQEARRFAALIPEGDRVKGLIMMEIQLGETQIRELDQMIGSEPEARDGFRQMILQSERMVHDRHQRPANLQQILEGMIETGSFQGAIAYVDKLPDESARGFARNMLCNGLSTTGLIGVHKLAAEKASQAGQMLFQAMNEKLAIAQQNGNFEPVIAHIRTLQNGFFRSALAIEASITMVNLAIAQEQEQSGKGQPILEQVRELYKLIPEYLDFFNDERHPSLEDLLILLRRAGLEAEAVQLEHRVKLWTK